MRLFALLALLAALPLIAQEPPPALAKDFATTFGPLAVTDDQGTVILTRTPVPASEPETPGRPPVAVLATASADPAPDELAAVPASLGVAELASAPAGAGPLDPADRRALGWELREAGWSNKRIARELGVHPSTVGRWFAVAHLTDTNTADEREETTP